MRPQDCMKVGIVHFMAYSDTIRGEGEIESSARRLMSDGYFSVLEVGIIKDPQVRRRLAEMARERKVTLVYGGQPRLLLGKLSLCSTDDDNRRRAIEACRQSAEEAVELGAVGLGVLSGAYEGEAVKERQTDLLVESLVELGRYCADRGVGLVLETFDRSIGKNALIGPTAEAVAVSRRVREEVPGFGLLIDLSHLPLLGETPEQALTTAGDHLVHAHIGNCVMREEGHPAFGDEHPPFGIPEGENGARELADFLYWLGKIGYIGVGKQRIVSFEVKPLPGMSSEEVVANAKATLEEAWSMLDKSVLAEGGA